MAHNTRVRADYAAWATGAVTQDEFDKLDRNAFVGINGDAGGTWAPSSIIVIGGSGLQLSSAPLVLTGTALLSAGGAAYELGAGRFYGAAQFDHGVTIGTNVMDSLLVNSVATFYAQATFLSTVIIGDASTDALTINSTTTFAGPQIYTGAGTYNGTETHNGTEYHNGQEEHAGAVYLNGDAIVAAGHDVSGFEVITASGSVRAWNSPNCMVLALSSGGGAITMSAPGGHAGVRKFIKCAANAAYSAQVIDGYSGLSMYTLAAGDSCWIISDGTRWV